MSKILITGGQGQLAYELVQLARQKNHLIWAPPREELDITQPLVVREALDTFQPDVVINTAAYTQVDKAEKNTQQAYAVNTQGAKNLALACEKISRPLLHLSTDYVFDGNKKSPYLETDKVAPINVYGASKWQGEEGVRQSCSRYIILRVSSVFGQQGQNFVKKILQWIREKESLYIVADQTMCPTPAQAIADTLLKIMTMPHWGTYHYCGEEAVTWYDFAKAIMEQVRPYIGGGREIHPISMADYPTEAMRPVYSVLDCTQFENVFGIIRPNWRIGLKNVITALSTS
ncbi:MAG: rmlD 2 [Gammaproteobacteria bacterium]|jgi:dTDP-4-dehydrorhamnose reductase|nr:rmlD 2 [Gammaproteobacteria bacterium]